VTSLLFDIHDVSTPPVTVKSPALAAEIAAREPHNAEQPILVILFMFLYAFL
jgi:hypothetical protein